MSMQFSRFLATFRHFIPEPLSSRDLTSCFPTSLWMDRFGTVRAAQRAAVSCRRVCVQTHVDPRCCWAAHTHTHTPQKKSLTAAAVRRVSSPAYGPWDALRGVGESLLRMNLCLLTRCVESGCSTARQQLNRTVTWLLKNDSSGDWNGPTDSIGRVVKKTRCGKVSSTAMWSNR